MQQTCLVQYISVQSVVNLKRRRETEYIKLFLTFFQNAFVRNKVFGSESSAIADVYYLLMYDHTEWIWSAGWGVSVVQVPDTWAQRTYPSGNVADQLSATLQKRCKSVLPTEAELLLAMAGPFLLLDIVSYDFPSVSSLCLPCKNFFLGILAWKVLILGFLQTSNLP